MLVDNVVLGSGENYFVNGEGAAGVVYLVTGAVNIQSSDRTTTYATLNAVGETYSFINMNININNSTSSSARVAIFKSLIL